MPCHVAINPSINYVKGIVQVGDDALTNDCSDESNAKVLNFSVKKIRKMMKEKRSDIKIF